MFVAIAILGMAGWRYFRGIGDGEQTSGMLPSISITNWRSDPGELMFSASFSPYAKMVAFVATKSQGTEIWVKPVSGGNDIQVTKNGFYNQYPIWSPDGQEIAFFSSRGKNRGIWRAAFTGGEQTPITIEIGPIVRPVYWSPSGKIYFQEGSDLFTVNESSGERQPTTDFKSKGLMPRTIEVSPDELMIAYSIKEKDGWKLKVERFDTEGAKEIATSKEQILYLAWDPVGTAVVFSSLVDGTYQMFRADIGGSPPIQLTNGDSNHYVQDISDDGAKILYGTLTETSDLWSVSTENSSQSSIANEVAAEFWADFSPDGRSIVFQSVTVAGSPFSGSIKGIPFQRSGAPMMVSLHGFSPVWSHNGQWIASFRRTRTGFAINRATPTGDENVWLADGALTVPGYTETPYLKINVDHLSWSADDGRLAYAATTEGVSNIWFAASDGSGSKQVTLNSDTGETFCCPAWSRDGKHLAYLSQYISDSSPRHTNYRLWLHRMEDGEPKVLYESNQRFRFLGFGQDESTALFVQLADPAHTPTTPAIIDLYSLSISTGASSKINSLADAYFHNIHLSKDGRTIAFTSRRDNITALWTVPVDGGAPRQLLVEYDPKLMLSSLAWAPDGKSIVFGRQTRTNLLSMLAK